MGSPSTGEGGGSNGVKMLLEDGSDTRMDEEEKEEGNRRGSDAEAASSWPCCNGQPEWGGHLQLSLAGGSGVSQWSAVTQLRRPYYYRRLRRRLHSCRSTGCIDSFLDLLDVLPLGYPRHFSCMQGLTYDRHHQRPRAMPTDKALLAAHDIAKTGN